MKIVTVSGVIDRNRESIDTVTELVRDWTPLILEAARIGDNDLELVVMPMPYMLNEDQEPAQSLVFYDEDTNKPTQVQIAGIWLAGAMWTDDNDEEFLEVFQPGDERFARSVLESLTVSLLEMHAALKGGLAAEARNVVRDHLREEAAEIVSELLGAPPDSWLGAPKTDKKVLN